MATRKRKLLKVIILGDSGYDSVLLRVQRCLFYMHSSYCRTQGWEDLAYEPVCPKEILKGVQSNDWSRLLDKGNTSG